MGSDDKFKNNEGGAGKKKKVLAFADHIEEMNEVCGPPVSEVERVLLTEKKDLLPYADGQNYAGLFITAQKATEFLNINKFLFEYALLDLLPVGLLLVDNQLNVTRSNRQFDTWAGLPSGEVVGKPFYALLGMPQITGEEPSPFHQARIRRELVETELQHRERQQYFEMDVTPVIRGDEVDLFIVVLRDIAPVAARDRKLKALQEAGKDLADMTAELLLSLTGEQRIQLLKEKIVQYTENILHYDNIEIRLLSHDVTGRLDPLLQVGMDEEAASRELFASPDGENGVTGYVAYHGKRYLIEDTQSGTDPFYLTGVTGARSSMTVPLVMHGKVIGTFNVESLEPRAFSEMDMEFLEAFARDIARALNTMDLFTVEQSDAFVRSVEAIHAAVAVPINAIVNGAATILGSHGGLDPDAANGLRGILTNARDVQMLIQSIGDKMVPAQGHPIPPGAKRPLLDKKKILLIDGDESVGLSMQTLLLWHGCVVEMVANGEQALILAQNMQFDLYFSDIHLSDMNGYDLLLRLKEETGLEYVPMILMKGYGYDRDHVTVKARQAGVTGFLPKPFTLDLLISAMERVLEEAKINNAPC